jgi:hypothetical protein
MINGWKPHNLEIRTSILSGCVEDAITLLQEHFPSVLSTTIDHGPEPRTDARSVDRSQYIPLTSVDPTHLSLNLRILSFIESCRTYPLLFEPPEKTSLSHPSHSEPPKPLYNIDNPDEVYNRKVSLLAKAQKLYATVTMLQKPSDREIYHEELQNVCGLLAYEIPEESFMSRYLSQERREAVAKQINSAILCECAQIR